MNQCNDSKLTGADFCLEIGKSSVDWCAARKYCLGLGGDLYNAQSFEEENEIKKLLAGD